MNNATMCPRCNRRELETPMERNALSRKDNKTYVCSSCGTDEAMISYRSKGKADVWPGYPKKMIVALAAIMLALALTACGGGEVDEADDYEPAPAPVYETTREAEPIEEEIIEEEPSEEEISDEEITDLALELSWSEMSPSDQEDLCFGWDLDSTMMLNAFMDGAGEDFNRTQVRNFFDRKC